MINTIQYLEKEFHNQFLITADDTPMNILNFHYANNFSNLELPGYLYNIRRNTNSRPNKADKRQAMVCYNYLLYFKLLYKYLKEFKKDMNFFFYELNIHYEFLVKLKALNDEYTNIAINFIKDVIQNDISEDLSKLLNRILKKLSN